jgi:hypothetical protein
MRKRTSCHARARPPGKAAADEERAIGRVRRVHALINRSAIVPLQDCTILFRRARSPERRSLLPLVRPVGMIECQIAISTDHPEGRPAIRARP